MPRPTRRAVLEALAGGAAAAFARPLATALGQTAPLQDPLRPQYHLLPERGWMNDPCGPIYWQGKYHMFFQYNPHAAVWGDMHWAHAVSPDAVHWERLALALAPTPGGPDAAGCFTGSAVVENGVPTLLYTGIQDVPHAQATLSDGTHNFRESQCLATSSDPMLRSWNKRAQPVIPAPPAGMHVTGFRDPAPFRVGSTWYTLVASGEPKKGGDVLLYRSADLRQWEYLHPIDSGKWNGKTGGDPVDSGEMWECPDFFQLGGKWVLIHSTERKTYWQVGELEPTSLLFHAETTGELDPGAYYAPKTQTGASGERILWGWIPERRPEAEYSAAGWAGMMSLPRLLTVENGELRMGPARGLETLRTGRSHPGHPTLHPSSQGLAVMSTAVELTCTLVEANGRDLPLTVDTPEGMLLSIVCDPKATSQLMRVETLARGKVAANETRLNLRAPLRAGATLQIFLDHSVMECFLDRRYAVTQRFYSLGSDRAAVALTLPGQWSLADVQVSSMANIWA